MLLKMLEDIECGLVSYLRTDTLLQPAINRLAFRELGLSIGLHALDIIKSILNDNQDKFKYQKNIKECLNKLSQFRNLADEIEAYWLDSKHTSTRTWKEHYKYKQCYVSDKF